MSYKVKLHRGVVRALAGLPPNFAPALSERCELCKRTRFSLVPVQTLFGQREQEEGLFRLRIGHYRAIYAVVGNVVYVTDLFHRGKGY